MNASAWGTYRPRSTAPWNWVRAWTLRRRAGFGATWSELVRDVEDGPEAAVDRVLAGACRKDGITASFEETAGFLGDAAENSADPNRLQAWWVFRMLFTPDPLAERVALLWHDHFATSQLKVNSLTAMRRQNETFRRLGRGPFGELLKVMLKDPALLVWLDAPLNRKGKPNENLARELMELFTLGVGHYTETDVKETARALTGHTVLQGRYAFRETDHDVGVQTILGRSSAFTGEELADWLLAQPATAERLSWRICRSLLGEGVADGAAVAALAEQLRRDDLHVGRAIESVLRSERFFADANLQTRIADPPGYVVGALRSVEYFDPPPSTLLVAEWMRRLGQVLFYPPNVGGWPGGRSWLSGRTVLARGNFAAALMDGKIGRTADEAPRDLEGLAKRHGRGSRPADVLACLGELVIGRRPSSTTCDEVLEVASTSDGDAPLINRSAALLLARPEAQLC